MKPLSPSISHYGSSHPKPKNIFPLQVNAVKALHSLPLEVEWSFYGTHRFKRHRILVVDSESDWRSPLRDELGDAGFQVTTAGSGSIALMKARVAMPSLIVLRLGSPGNLGWEVCRLLKADKATSPIPIIILAAQSTADERTQGLELGADDFLTQPFGSRELTLRIRNSLERAERNQPAEVKMTLNDLVLDPVRHEVTLHQRPLYLSLNEFRLLNLFMERCGDVLDRDTLLSEVWGQVSITVTRTVDTHVKRLRKRLGPWARHLESIRGTGYRLNPDIRVSAEQPERAQSRHEAGPYFLQRLDKRKALIPRSTGSRLGFSDRNAKILVGAGHA